MGARAKDEGRNFVPYQMPSSPSSRTPPWFLAIDQDFPFFLR